jgi:hypothetical protein
MNRLALIATVAAAFAVAGCGEAHAPKAAFTVGVRATCVRGLAPLKRKTPPSVSAHQAPRAAIGICYRAYLGGRLELLPRLAPVSRAQLANAVGQVALIGAMRPTSRPSGFAAPVTATPRVVYLP